MRSRFGLRRRLIWVLIGLVALTAATVGALSVILVDRSLRAQRVEDAVASAEFNLTVLAPAAGLPDPVDPDGMESSGLLDRFLRRGTDGVWVEFPGGERLATPGLGEIAISEGLRELAEAGQLAYEFSETATGLALVTAGRLPPSGPTFFFVTSAQTVTDATRQLLLVVTSAGLAVIALGALVATALARRMLRPVAAASTAAQQMAAGDLDVRLEDEGPDEFGRLSGSFNTMAESLRGTIDELEAARARERRFVADVSHELRTPLTSLVNEAAMLRDRLERADGEESDASTIAGMLDADVRKLRRLVEDLLEISRLDLASHPPAPSLVDVTAFLGALLAERHPEAELVSTVDSPVMVEPRGLERVIGNLLDNARHHAAGTQTTVSASTAKGMLEIEVADRGPGVPPDQLERIFERFATADPARGTGTGLGLAIAAQHAARMGGAVAASLRPGGGLA
ncbi:MAG TPA: HAMP domain-containing sensor histidine kinase, partial [Acidimicrobiia bacterium]|nr:HAMP domain-containing sensor histidine kinase [Acidimicrobiia bacterium]